MKGFVYKLINSEDSFYYIGSSCRKRNDLKERLRVHLSDCEHVRNNNNKLYSHMKKIGKDKFNIIKICTVEIDSLRELRKIENEYINLNDINILNVKKSSGVYKNEYTNDADYEKSRYKNVDKEKEQLRGKARWLKIKNDNELLKQHNENVKKSRIRCQTERQKFGYGSTDDGVVPE